jgi:FkbM family methyltransferase
LDPADWLCSEIYFKHYLPVEGDVVVDIGTGYGHEIAWLCSRSAATVLCAEPNPEVFSYLSANLSGCRNVALHNKMVGDAGVHKFPFSSDYASSGAGSRELNISVMGITFEELTRSVGEVALLKLNIEGGERELLSTITLDRVRRVVVSCHDFRAARGDGDYFRTHEFVSSLLARNGFTLKGFAPSAYPTPAWRHSVPFWIFGERR